MSHKNNRRLLSRRSFWKATNVDMTKLIKAECILLPYPCAQYSISRSLPNATYLGVAVTSGQCRLSAAVLLPWKPWHGSAEAAHGSHDVARCAARRGRAGGRHGAGWYVALGGSQAGPFVIYDTPDTNNLIFLHANACRPHLPFLHPFFALIHVHTCGADYSRNQISAECRARQ